MPPRTAGIIVIGDEILKGMTRDTNSLFISKKLYSIGVKLKKISVIPDEVNTISAEIYEFSKKYDLVITSGGIGPTHDDVTYEGAAKAFGEELKVHKEMAKYVYMIDPDEETVSKNASLKMANLPASAKIVNFQLDGISSHTTFPIVRVFNVLLFPGIPQYLEGTISLMKITDFFPNETFNSSFASAPKFHSHKLYYKVDETELVETLNRAVGLFRNNVNFGCYPVLGKNYRTLIVIDSFDELLAARARMYAKAELAHGSEVPPPTGESSDQVGDNADYSFVSRKVSERVFCLLKNPETPTSLLEPLDKAMKTVEKCFTNYDSGMGVFISFNGGKDCTALLHLIFAFYTKHHPKGPPLTALYIQTKDPFPELEDFVQEAALRYNIQLQVQPGPLKEALQKFIYENELMKAVFIGTRRTDPKSVSLQPFQMTDGDWPRIMRVSPLLDWSYENIWTFLRLLSVPYCSLYDEGYTSIGDQKNTFPNPALKYQTDDGETKYHPAYMLDDETIERSGRESDVLKYAAELTSDLAEVIAPAFGPNGVAILFAQTSNPSVNSTGISPLISRTGLQIVEILALRNAAKTIHPLLKSLVDSCRILDLEWGDGVKSLVLITSELLRHCAMLECNRRPGWLRRELGKALDLLSKSCELPDGNPSLSVLPTDSKPHQEKCSPSFDKYFSIHTLPTDKLINGDSQFISNHYAEVYDLLKMIFYTRFPFHIAEVVPSLLCEWVKGVEKDGKDIEFVINNFSSLCHVNVGVPMDRCRVLNGVMVQGFGIGYLFGSKGDNFRKESCSHSLHNYDVNAEKRTIHVDGCHGCVNIKVEIITDHEVSSAFGGGKDQFEFKANYLYLTSYIPSDFIKFKICQLDTVSLIHSIPVDDVDFLRVLMQEQKSSHSTIAGCFFVNWVRRWPENPFENSNLFWLGVPGVWSLILCVPVLGMKDGLKNSCYNALSLIRQFKLHSNHKCNEKINLCPHQCAQDSCVSSKGEPSNYPLNGNEGQSVIQKGISRVSSASILLLNATLCSEKLLSNDVKLSELENMIAAGGLAEVYLHDMVISWWLTPPHTGGESIDREVTKAIALALLTVPISLSTKGKLISKRRQPLTFNFNSKAKELIAHRLRILHLAVNVAFSLSNVSDVMLTSKSTSKKNITTGQNVSDSDDSD